MVTVTIYNDDEHGRAIKIVRVNPFTGISESFDTMEAGSDGQPESKQFEVRNGEMLIIVTAEKDTG